MKRSNAIHAPILEDWYRTFTPSKIILRNIKTGEQIQELSLVAAKIKTVEHKGNDPYTGEALTGTCTVLEKYLAAGKAALEYEKMPDVMVFSPLRQGQIAHYDAAQYLFRDLLKRISPKLQLLKPVLVIHIQAQTTQVEERAMIDAGIQAGAREILLYQQPLSLLLEHIQKFKKARNGIVIHISPQDETVF